MFQDDRYNVKRVHKVSLIITIFVALLITIQATISKGMAHGLRIGTQSSTVIVLVIIVFFLPIKDYLKGLLFALVPGVAIMALFYLNNFAIDKHYILISTVALAALYFKKEIILIHGLTMDVLFILVYFLNPSGILSVHAELSQAITVLVVFNGIIGVLYFLTKWGRNLVDESYKNEMKVNELLNKLQNTINNVEESTEILVNNVTIVNENVNVLVESRETISLAMQEMTSAISEESDSLYKLNSSMEDSLNHVDETRSISIEIGNKSSAMKTDIDEGYERLKLVNSQIKITKDAIKTAVETVEDLKNSISKVNLFLEGIKQITSQTNLLALNASIEAARAGENGRGFSVVAEEIRKLAEESTQIAEDINEVTVNIFTKCDEAYSKVIEGEEATIQGTNLIDEILNYFDLIRELSNETYMKVKDEIEQIDEISNNFKEIQNQTDTMAGISQQNASSIEEVLAIITEENNQILNLRNSMNEIDKMCIKLKELINI